MLVQNTAAQQENAPRFTANTRPKRLFRESNPGSPAPVLGIIPLANSARHFGSVLIESNRSDRGPSLALRVGADFVTGCKIPRLTHGQARAVTVSASTIILIATKTCGLLCGGVCAGGTHVSQVITFLPGMIQDPQSQQRAAGCTLVAAMGRGDLKKSPMLREYFNNIH